MCEPEVPFLLGTLEDFALSETMILKGRVLSGILNEIEEGYDFFEGRTEKDKGSRLGAFCGHVDGEKEI